MFKRLFVFTTLIAMAALQSETCTQAIAADPSSPPNVLFIAVDDLKPVLGCYGDQQVISPSIDRIAKGGTVFLNAQCQWPVCGPTRASLMTSLRPEATGVMNLKTSMRAKNPDILTLPQHFKNNGYTTAGAGKIYDPRCVDNKRTLDEPSWSIPFAKMPYSKIKFGSEKQFALAPELPDTELADGQITLSGLKLMRKLSKGKQPFFLAVGFKKPHLPFIAPKKYWNMYQRDQFSLATHRGGIENASGYSVHNSNEMRGYKGIPAEGEISDALQREAIHGYYACVSYIDAQIGMLLDELDTLGLSDNTTIVFWGDHGFHLGDHGMWGKHSTLEHAARVPLIIRPPPGKLVSGKLISGKSISDAAIPNTAIPSTTSPVEFTDIFPTLCEIASINFPANLSGRSLMPIVQNKSSKVRNGAITVFKAKGSIGYSYRTERYRYTQWINKQNKVAATELYDYETDPEETKNRANDPNYADTAKKLANQMRADGNDCDRLQASAASN